MSNNSSSNEVTTTPDETFTASETHPSAEEMDRVLPRSSSARIPPWNSSELQSYFETNDSDEVKNVRKRALSVLMEQPLFQHVYNQTMEQDRELTVRQFKR